MSKPVLYLFNGKVGAFGRAFLGFTPPPTYTVTLDTVTHGSITASPMSGIAGTTITLTSTPDSGYELDYFTVNGVAIIGNTFTMPAENVTVGAVFVEESIHGVTIGTQVWADRNLAIDDGEGGITTRTVNYGQGDVVEYFYTWDAAVRVAASIPRWHLPTSTEFDAMVSYIGSNAGQKLKSTYGWTNNGNGTDEFGFTALPTGCYLSSGYKSFGERTSFWSSTIGSSVDYPDAYSLFNSMNTVLSGTGSKWNGYSVRLIKDS